MAYKCAICGKGVMYGHNVSHAKNRTRRRFRPNLRYGNIRLNGESTRVRLCMKCLKRAKKDGTYVLPYVKAADEKPLITEKLELPEQMPKHKPLQIKRD